MVAYTLYFSFSTFLLNSIDIDAADFNQDGIINVIDIVNLVNYILN